MAPDCSAQPLCVVPKPYLSIRYLWSASPVAARFGGGTYTGSRIPDNLAVNGEFGLSPGYSIASRNARVVSSRNSLDLPLQRLDQAVKFFNKPWLILTTTKLSRSTTAITCQAMYLEQVFMNLFPLRFHRQPHYNQFMVCRVKQIQY